MGKSKFYQIHASKPGQSYIEVFQDYNTKWAIGQFRQRHKGEAMVEIYEVKEYFFEDDTWRPVEFCLA